MLNIHQYSPNICHHLHPLTWYSANIHPIFVNNCPCILNICLCSSQLCSKLANIHPCDAQYSPIFIPVMLNIHQCSPNICHHLHPLTWYSFHSNVTLSSRALQRHEFFYVRCEDPIFVLSSTYTRSFSRLLSCVCFFCWFQHLVAPTRIRQNRGKREW